MVNDRENTPHAGKKLWIILGIICALVFGGWLFTYQDKPAQQADSIHESIPQTNGDKMPPTQLKDASTAHQEIVTAYISNFLRKGYEKYYTIQEIDHRFVSQQIKDGQFEAVVITTMKSRPQDPASDPDTVSYIKESREKAEKETNPGLKKVDQKIYETMKQEYGRAEESNYTFKLTAQLDSETIDENSIKLYLVQDAAPNHTEYLPAEELFQK